MRESWFCEKHTEGYQVQWKVKELLHQEKTPFQELVIADLEEWGKTLILDGAVQVTEKDEFIYHEMLAHVAMFSHPDPKRVLVIGGGDGGTAREVLKHPGVETLDMVEIDARVVENSRKYLPTISCALEDPRLNLYFEDGIKFVQQAEEQYDIVLVDSSDPVGPAIELYGEPFYQDVHEILAGDGMIAVQSESPIFYQDIFQTIYSNLNSIFPLVKVYLATVPTYVSGPWSFTIGSKKNDPEQIDSDRPDVDGLEYYNEDVHTSAFALPQYIKKYLR